MAIKKKKYKKKFLIFYDESLRSKVIYNDFLLRYKNLVEAFVEVPSLNNKRFKFRFIKKLLSYPLHIKIYYLFVYFFYLFLTKLNKSSIENLCKKKKYFTL